MATWKERCAPRDQRQLSNAVAVERESLHPSLIKIPFLVQRDVRSENG